MLVPAAPLWGTANCKLYFLANSLCSLWSRALDKVQPCHMLTVLLWESYFSILNFGLIFKVEIVVSPLWGELGLVLHIAQYLAYSKHIENVNYLFL